MLNRRLAFFIGILAIVLAVFLFTRSEKPQVERAADVEPYSFFVAGHVSGKPSVDNAGFHPPFKQKLSQFMASDTPADFGVLTGGVVYRSTQKDWAEIDRELEHLNVPVHIAAGNNDRGGAFIKQRQKDAYYAFEQGPDLFIILEIDLKSWSVNGAQLDFLKNSLSDAASHRNVFIFMHQLAWWEPENAFSCAQINSVAGKKGPSNFLPEIMPILKAIEQDVYVFAGDTGAFLDHTPMFYRDENVSLIASGMGGGNGNFLAVNVANKVDVELVWLNDLDTPGLSPRVLDKVANNRPLIEDYQIDCASQQVGPPAQRLDALIANMNDAVKSDLPSTIPAASDNAENVRPEISKAGTASLPTNPSGELEAFYKEGILSVTMPQCRSQEDFAQIKLTAFWLEAGEQILGPPRSDLRGLRNRHASYFEHEGTPFCSAKIPLDPKKLRMIRGQKAPDQNDAWKFEHIAFSHKGYVAANQPTPMQGPKETTSYAIPQRSYVSAIKRVGLNMLAAFRRSGNYQFQKKAILAFTSRQGFHPSSSLSNSQFISFRPSAPLGPRSLTF